MTKDHTKLQFKLNKKLCIIAGAAVIAVIAAVVIICMILGSKDRTKTLTAWPAKEFPQVPVFETSDYGGTLKNNRADILLPNADSAAMDAYEDTLIAAGAVRISKNDYMSTFIFEDMDIQLIRGEAVPTLILLDEPTIEPDLGKWSDFPMLSSGRIVDAQSEANTIALSYRGVLLSDIADLCDLLLREGWITKSIDNAIVPEGDEGMFYQTFIKGSNSVTVDYYGNVMECLITMSADGASDSSPADSEASLSDSEASESDAAAQTIKVTE